MASFTAYGPSGSNVALLRLGAKGKRGVYWKSMVTDLDAGHKQVTLAGFWGTFNGHEGALVGLWGTGILN